VNRDQNLIRNILLDVENFPAGKWISLFEFEGKEQPEIAEHVQLLINAGFIEGQTRQGSIGEITDYTVLG
jgi:hypothetical protein